MVAPRINVVRDANGAYVLGNGFAFGTESMPAGGVVSGAAGLPAAATGSGAGAGAACPAAHPSTAASDAMTAKRDPPAESIPGVSRRERTRRVRTRVIV